jgi:hypothetical protein
MYFIAVVALALSFSGCSSVPPDQEETTQEESPSQTQASVSQSLQVARTIPITDEIIDVIKAKPNASELYYYISKPILLRLVSESEGSTIENHELHLFGSIRHSTIRITEFTPGLSKDASFGTSLNIAFQNDQGSPVLTFLKQGYGSSERYELITNSNGYVIHNNLNYAVEYSGREVPYLLIVVVQELDG